MQECAYPLPPRMKSSLKLRYCVAANCVVFVLILIVITIYKDGKTKYLHWGPNADLYVLSVKIDTWSKYMYLQLFLLCVECSRVFTNEIASPILGFNIYNPDKKVIIEFSKNELQVMANIMWLVNSLTTGLFVLITISQFDIAVLRIVYSELTTVVTIRLLLNEKEFILNKVTDTQELDSLV